nr:serine hydrolase [Cellulomonas sp. APG4]
MERLGGPAGLEAALADLGNATTKVADVEPGLNRVDPADAANTTTPRAFTATLRSLLLTAALTDDDRALLLDWASGNATGDALVRAGAPAGWEVADKSGGAGAIRNDVAVVTPPGRAPILLTILTEKRDPAAAYDDALVARVAETVLTALV